MLSDEGRAAVPECDVSTIVKGATVELPEEMSRRAMASPHSYDGALERHDNGEDLPPAWTSAYPWLDDKATGELLQLRVELRPLDPSDAEAHRLIASFILEWRSGGLFADLFPSIPDDALIRHDGLPARAANALAREGVNRFGDLASRTVRSFMVLRNIGALSITAILEGIAELQAAAPTPVQPLPRRRVHRPGSAELTPSTQLLEDLELVGLWDIARGVPDTRLLSSREVGPDAPFPLRAAVARLSQLTSGQWTAQGRSDALFGVLESKVQAIGDRERAILLRREAAVTKVSLDVLGSEFGVTRERVRQIEMGFRKDFSRWLNDDSGIGFYVAALRSRIGALSHESDVIAELPVMSRPISGSDVTVLQLADALDDGFEGADQWLAVPSLSAAREATQARFDDLTDEQAGAAHDDIVASFHEWTDLSESRIIEWLEYLKYTRIGAVWVAPGKRSIPDLTIALLGNVGSPMTIDQISRAFDGERAVNSIKNALAADGRIVRVGLDQWGLVEWGGAAYTSIKDAIAEAISESDGAIGLDTLIGDLTARFDVAASSVRSYASSWPFVSVRGVVRFAERRAPVKRAREFTRNLYISEGAVRFRFVVNDDRLRGSGMPVPIALCLALGIEPGGKRVWSGGAWQIALSWERSQPAMSSVRNAVASLDAERDDDVMITWSGESISAEVLQRSVGITAVLNLVGLRGGAGLEEVAALLGTSSDRGWPGIVERAAARGESDLAAAAASMIDNRP